MRMSVCALLAALPCLGLVGLYEANVAAGARTQIGKAEFAKTQQLFTAGELLYCLDDTGSLYRISPSDGTRLLIGNEGDWKDTRLTAVLHDTLYSVSQDGSLWAGNLATGKAEPAPTPASPARAIEPKAEVAPAPPAKATEPKAKEMPQDRLAAGTQWKGTWDGIGKDSLCTVSVRARDRSAETATIALVGSGGGVLEIGIKTSNDGALFKVLTAVQEPGKPGAGTVYNDVEGNGTVNGKKFKMSFSAKRVNGNPSKWEAEASSE